MANGGSSTAKEIEPNQPREENVSASRKLEHKVVLIDYAEALFSPIGFEGDMLAQAGADWQTFQCRTGEQALQVAKDAEVVIIQSVRPLLTRKVLAQLPRCRCAIRAGAGYDSIDYKAATEYGIMVCNAPTYCTNDVADHAMALLLSSVRHVARLDAAIRKGQWACALARPTRRLKGATLGIIGLGASEARWCAGQGAGK